MATTLLLIRHGETPWNSLGKIQGLQNINLEAAGKAQAQRLCERLKGNFDVIYTSPLNRAQETAEILCQSTPLKPIAIPELREIDFGAWEGLTFKEVASTYAEVYSKWLSDDQFGPMVNGDGSLYAVSQRAKACITELIAKHPNETVAIVSHGGFIKCALIGLFNWKMTMYHHFALGNTCVTTLRFNHPEDPVLLGLNDTNHLLHTATCV